MVLADVVHDIRSDFSRRKENTIPQNFANIFFGVRVIPVRNVALHDFGSTSIAGNVCSCGFLHIGNGVQKKWCRRQNVVCILRTASGSFLRLLLSGFRNFNGN